MGVITLVTPRLRNRISNDPAPDLAGEDGRPKFAPEFPVLIFFPSKYFDGFSYDFAFVAGYVAIQVVRVADDSVLVDDLHDRAVIYGADVVVQHHTGFFAVGDVNHESERLDRVSVLAIYDVRMIVNETDTSVGMEYPVVQIVFRESAHLDVLVDFALHAHEIVGIDEFDERFTVAQEIFRSVSEILRNVRADVGDGPFARTIPREIRQRALLENSKEVRCIGRCRLGKYALSKFREKSYIGKAVVEVFGTLFYKVVRTVEIKQIGCLQRVFRGEIPNSEFDLPVFRISVDRTTFSGSDTVGNADEIVRAVRFESWFRNFHVRIIYPPAAFLRSIDSIFALR